MLSLKGFLGLRQHLRPGVELRGRKSIPIRVENRSGMSAKQRDLVGHLSSLAQGDDGECAAARCIPID